MLPAFAAVMFQTVASGSGPLVSTQFEATEGEEAASHYYAQ